MFYPFFEDNYSDSLIASIHCNNREARWIKSTTFLWLSWQLDVGSPWPIDFEPDAK